ncbi:MAG: hypothetical protein M9947_10850 [Thermomicrobiales bacterium]|nr:hypothetical protein [Thermomicrobiales bacterium]
MKIRAIRIGAALLLALMLPVAAMQATTYARQADACEGLDAYIAQMESVGDVLEANVPLDDDTDLQNWTSEDFAAANAYLTTALEGFQAIDPPAIAEDYHAALLVQTDLLTQMFEAMEQGGIFAIFLFIDQIDAAEKDMEAGAQQVEAACGIDLIEVSEGETETTDTGAITVTVSIESGGFFATAGNEAAAAGQSLAPDESTESGAERSR